MHRFALLLLSLRSRFVDVVSPAMQAFTGSDSGLGLRVLCELTSRVWVPSKGWLLIGMSIFPAASGFLLSLNTEAAEEATVPALLFCTGLELSHL